MSEAPSFWWRANALSWALWPVSWAYGRAAARRMSAPPSARLGVPVLCIGNFIVGGAGKTPTAIAVADAAVRLGRRPGFLSRGYGGAATEPTMVDLSHHNSRDVGDEPIVLAGHYPTAVTPDRPAGGRMLEEAGVDFVVMDDGFQNPGLHRDLALVVVDSRRGLGNGMAMPSGPLRAELATQMRHADALVVVGQGPGSSKAARLAARSAKPILDARQEPLEPHLVRSRRCLAFAGIGDPGKFYATLAEAGAEVVVTRDFEDHRPYTDEECEDLIASAEREDLLLVTTEKDAARLWRRGTMQQTLSERAQVLRIEMRFDEPATLDRLVRRTIERERSARLKLKRARPVETV